MSVLARAFSKQPAALLGHLACRNSGENVIQGEAQLLWWFNPGWAQVLSILGTVQAHHQGSHGQQSSGQHGGRSTAATAAPTVLGAAAVMSTLWPSQADCAAQPGPGPFQPAAGQEPWRWLSLPGWLTSWLPGCRGANSGGIYLEAMHDDPRVAVVMAFALPFLALSFGYQPSQADMEAAGKLIQTHLQYLRPWEVAVLMWGAARLGYRPDPGQLRELQERVRDVLEEPPSSLKAFSPQEACMASWALSVMEAQDPELWAAELAFVAACPAGAIDEVALIHLWQAALFVPRSAVTAPVPGAAGGTAAIVPRMRSASDEVRATLAAGGCPLALITRCEEVYRAASRQPGFDGPFLTELTMLRLLITIYQELGDSAAFAPFFEDLQLLDLEHAKQLLEDPYLLAKFKSEIGDKRAQQNNFTRTLADVSRTLRDLGLHHVVQAPVEDGLVHVDIALPDYKVAFFLDAAPRTSSSGGARLSSLDAEGTVLSGYIANETLGTKQAKLRVLQEHGWVVLPLRWIENIRGEAEKRRLLLLQIDKAGQQQLMRGRVSAMLHEAMRTAEESKLGRERYGDRGSAGQYITRTPRE